jgi:hypothetical protein
MFRSKNVAAIALAALLTACADAPETRDCLVSLDGRCLAYDFESSRALNPMGNARELLQQ